MDEKTAQTAKKQHRYMVTVEVTTSIAVEVDAESIAAAKSSACSRIIFDMVSRRERGESCGTSYDEMRIKSVERVS